MAHQQVGGIISDESAGDAVNAEAVARDKAETIVACREPGDPFHVVKRVLELIGVHTLPLVAAVDRLLDGHAGLRVEDGTLIAAVAILQREDDGIGLLLNRQRWCHKPVACATAKEGCHTAARIIVCGYALLHRKAFAIAAEGHLVIVEIGKPDAGFGNHSRSSDDGRHYALVGRREGEQRFVLADRSCCIMEGDIHRGRVAGSNAELTLVNAEQLWIGRRDIDLQRARTGIDHDKLLGAVLGAYAEVHILCVQRVDFRALIADVQTVYRHQQVGRLFVDVETRHAVNLCVDIRYEAETVFSRRCARDGECLELVIQHRRVVTHAQPLVLAVFRALYHEEGVGHAHDGLHVETEPHAIVVALGFPGREHEILAVLDFHGRSQQIGPETVAAKHTAHAGHTCAFARVTARTHAGHTIVAGIRRGFGLRLAVVNFPALSKPAVRHLGAVVEPLVHLLGRYRLSLYVYSHEQEQHGKE